MELYTLNINVNKQRLSFGENKPEIFSGDQSIDFVEFTFEDDMWNFPNIWAIFSRFKGTSYQVSLEDNKVMIPAEVMQKRGYVYIGLMATDGENVQTSSVLQYSIGQGSTNVDAITPSASIYEQFLADLDAYQTAVADLDDIESRITTAAGNVSMIEQAVTDLNEQLGDINVDISTINGQITTIQNNIGTAQGDIVSIQNGINTLNGQVAGLDTAVGTLSNRVTALQSSVTSLEGRLTTVGNTLTDFEGRLTTAGTTLTNLEGSISDAENDIQTVQGDIETIQSDIEDIQTAIEQNNVVTDVTAEGISLVDNHIADLSFMCVTDTASGDVASFPDGSGAAMKKAEVSLEPIQDLHGYDKPWPAGGGKNKLPYIIGGTSGDATAVVSSDGSVTLNGTGYARFYTDYFTVPAGTYILNGNTDYPNTVIYLDGVSGSSDTNTGTTITFSEETTVRGVLQIYPDKTVSNLILKPMLRKSTESSTYSPYSNICPIDGYEDVGVSVRGFNQFDKDTMTVDGAYINNNTGVAVVNQDYKCTDFIKVVGGATYYVKTEQTNAGWGAWYDADKNYISGTTGWINNIATAPANAVYGRFTIASAQGGNPDTLCINLSDPSRNGTYEPYAGNDYTTTLVTNIWDEEWRNGYYVSTTGEFTANSQMLANKNPIRIMSNTTYYLKSTTYNIGLTYYDDDMNFIAQTGVFKNATFMTPSNAYYLNFANSWNAGATYNNDISINYPPMSDGKVYGGTVDLASGRLTVSYAYTTLDGSSDEGWALYSAFNGFTATGINDMKSGVRQQGWCDKLQTSTSTATGQTNACWFGAYSRYFYVIGVFENMGSTVEDFKTYLSTNPLQVVYPLATPQTYQLTPQQIQTLIGINNVWSEDGTIEVEYIANLKDYIDKKINA